MSSLKSRLISGFKWILLSNVLQRLLAIGAMAILARRLQPADFGLFALAFVAIDALELFQSLGLNAAVIQRKDLDERTTHTAFVLVLLAGLVITVTSWLLAPVFGIFFDNDKVPAVIRTLAVVFILGCFSRIPRALLNRQMRFRALSLIAFVGASLSSVLSVVYVLIWPSVWSLVLAYLSRQVVTTALYLHTSGYRPRLVYDRDRARELFSYGRFIIGASIATYLWMNVDNMVVGRILGTALLGYFTLGASIGDLVNKYFSNIISGMMFPAFSKMQDDPAFMERAFLKTTRLVTVAAFPFGLVLLTLAEPIVLTLYGDRWLPTIPLLRIFGLTASVTSLTACAPSLFRASGKPQYDLYIILGRLALRLPLLVLLARSHSLEGVAFAGLITVTVFTPITLAAVRKVAPFRLRDYLFQFWSVAAASGVMVVAVHFAHRALAGGLLGGLVQWPPATAAALGSVAVLAFGLALLALDRKLSSELMRMAMGSRS